MERSKIILIRIFQIALVVSAIGLSSGCQSKLTKEARAGINCVSINTELPMPNAISYGALEGASTWWGGVASLATKQGRVKGGRAIIAIMRENDINPSKILATQFKEQLEAKQVFPCIVRADGDASFTFEIWSGLMWDSSGGFPPYPLKPELTAVVYLKKPDGTLIWKNNKTFHWKKGTFFYDSTSEVDAYMHNEYIENPSLLRKGFEQAASNIVGKFLGNIEAN